MMRKLFIIENGSKQTHDTAERMIKLLGKGFERTADPESADMVLVFGGDGAFLHGLESCGFPEAPILGINTGHLGFFQELLPEVRVLALTTFDDVNTVSGALEAGCNGFLLKVIDPEKLRSSMLSIAGGLNVYDEDAISHLQQSLKDRRNTAFSSREREVLGYVCEGMTNAEIAAKLNLRPGTVKNMISLLLSKTDCISRAQLVKYAAENNLIE